MLPAPFKMFLGAHTITELQQSRDPSSKGSLAEIRGDVVDEFYKKEWEEFGGQQFGNLNGHGQSGGLQHG